MIYPLSLRNVEDLLAGRVIDICHETVRLWWARFGPMFAAEIRKKRCRDLIQQVVGVQYPALQRIGIMPTQPRAH